MRHHYISIAVFGLAFGLATGLTIIVAGKALSPRVITVAAPTPPSPPEVMMTSWGHHWHWHGMESAIRARVAAQLDAALARLDDLDVDLDDDDALTATPVVVR